MSLAGKSWGAALSLAASILVVPGAALAQQNIPHIALKSGESTELRDFFFIANCLSVLNGPTTIEVLDGPTEIALAIKDKMVLPRGYSCAKEVAGGSVVATAGQIDEPKAGKLIFRLNFKTKMGPRQTSDTYFVSLFP